MPRIARKNLEGNYFHVMVQGIGKEHIFPDDDSKGFYLTCLQKAKQFCNAKLLAFCVMGNHAHVLVFVNNTDLSKYFKHVNADYARYFNRMTNRVGYVFRDRFKSENITDEKYLLNCLAYIQNNPVKANMVEKAEDYKFSSYSNYLTQKGLVDFDETGKYFSTKPDNIRAIMQELTDSNWLEHDDKIYESIEDVFQELVEKYGLTKQRLKGDEVLLKKVIQEMQSRTRASLRGIANMCEMARETIRKTWSTPPSL